MQACPPLPAGPGPRGRGWAGRPRLLLQLAPSRYKQGCFDAAALPRRRLHHLAHQRERQADDVERVALDGRHVGAADPVDRETAGDALRLAEREVALPRSIVLVTGAGIVGLSATAIAADRGATVIVSEPDKKRRRLARLFGAAATIDPCDAGALETALRGLGVGGVEGVDIAVVLKTKEEGICRVSMRSKGLDVSAIAVQFGGAAGTLEKLGDTAAAVRAALANLDRAGLLPAVTLGSGDVLEIDAPAPAGIMIANPPYGERLSEQEELAAFYPQLGSALKRKFAGWTCYLLTADLRLPKLMRLTPSRKIPLYNGALECRLFEFRMVAGSNRT